MKETSANKQKNEKKPRMCIVNDQDGHKYKIPIKLKKQFELECEIAYKASSAGNESLILKFEDDFGVYMFG